MGLWQEQHRGDAVLFSLRALRWLIVWKCSLTDDVHSHHLIRVVSTRLLHCEVALNPLGIQCFYGQLLWNYVNALFFTKL